MPASDTEPDRSPRREPIRRRRAYCSSTPSRQQVPSNTQMELIRMKIKNLVGARQFSVVSVAALAVGMGGIGLAGAAPSYRSTPVSAVVANDTLTITGTNGPDNISVALAAGDPNTLNVDL